MKAYFKNPLLLSLSALIILIIGYGVFEYIEYSHTQDFDDPKTLAEESVQQAANIYESLHNELLEESEAMYGEIREQLEREQNRRQIFQTQSNYNFWGSMLYRDGEPWTWDGFNLSITPSFIDYEHDTLRTSVSRANNVSFLMGQISFVVNDASYRLLIAKKLEQSTNLPFADEISFNLANHSSLKNKYPVTFNFFDAMPEDQEFTYQTLSTTTSDSVGVVYSTFDDLPKYKEIHENFIAQWRIAFHASIFIALLVVFVIIAFTKRNWLSVLLQILFLSVLWYWITESGLISKWIDLFITDDSSRDVTNLTLLGNYIFNAIFLGLFFIVSFVALKDYERIGIDRLQIQGVLLSILYGILQVLLLIFFTSSTQQVTAETSIPLLDLELAPPITSFLLYIGAALFFTSIAGISITIGHFLFKFEQDKAVLIFISASFSFLTFAFLSYQFFTVDLFTGWQILIITLLFALFIITAWLIAYYPEYFKTMSGFRKMMMTVFLASIFIYLIIYNTSLERTDRELMDVAVEYSEEADSDAENILRTLLINLEYRLTPLTQEDILNNMELLRSRFQRAVQSNIRPEWQRYTFDIKLLFPSGQQITDFSTSLDSPAWTALFDTDLMVRSYRGEQIRMETNRPVIWGRPDGIGEDFRSFNRGWIPIYDSTNPTSIIAWIFGAVYQERPDFNKPIRAVLAAATDEDWKKSFYMAEFSGNRVIRSATKGIYTNQPEYNRLSDIESSIAMEDSVAYLTTITSQGSFREILLKQGERNVIKVSTPKPAFNNHVFSYFRLLIVLVFFGLFFMATLSMVGFKRFRLFGQSKRFQHRLIDGLTLSTFLFLTVLIFATQYALSNQNEKNLQRELIRELKNLGDSARLAADFSGDELSIPLAELTSPLNVDAIFYSNVWMAESTTPQIFQQHLIPRILPYEAYEFLYNRERRHVVERVQLGNETLLVGYRAILDDNNEPVGAIAIPTFVQSPIYTEQLLETISYLFAIYLAIFTLFIVGSVALSNRLTKPLELIQQGLSKITRGEKQAKITVSTEDEIGSLANAYNQMVQRLDEAQKELIKAERESAWKEMAQQVAHEIKNPLTPMKLNLQHLQRQLEANPDNVMDLKPQIEKTAANIIYQIESLNKIASDFSKFSKPIRDPFEGTDLKQLIRSVAELYNNDENVRITLQLPNSDLRIKCVPDEIRRVLINLLKNGIEASNSSPSKIEVRLFKSGEFATISISDNGKGIPDEDKDRIFVPNFSTKSSGTGLGLAITKKIIDAHEGRITFTSQLDRGTIFTIKLPFNPDESA